MHKAGWLIIVALTGGCEDGEELEVLDINGNGIPDLLDEETEPMNVDEWRATLVATDAATTAITGDVLVRRPFGEVAFVAVAKIRNDVPNVARPWDVREGTCARPGATVDRIVDYPPLTTGIDGAGLSIARINAELDKDDPYHVEVHRSEADLDTIIACGDLILRSEDDHDLTAAAAPL